MERAAKILGTMAIREVLKMGDPRLLAVAEPVLEFALRNWKACWPICGTPCAISMGPASLHRKWWVCAS